MTQMKSPFSEIWHNNEPMVLCYVNDIPKEKAKCESCKKDFPRGILSISPFDIAIKHEEKWKYVNRKRKGDTDPEYCVSPGYTTRFYCVSSRCIIERFPYFQKELVEIPIEMSIKYGHKELLKRQLGLSL